MLSEVVQAEHNAFLMCDKFEKPHWLELPVRPLYRFRRPGYGLSGLGH